MNKDEFLKAINNLKYKKDGYRDYSVNYEKEQGFEECKKQVIELIPDLDVQGMTPQTFEFFRQAMKDLEENYNNMFALQKELQIKNQQYIEVQRAFSSYLETKNADQKVEE